jgi:beta-barrel assembly-enhancing protease
MTFEPKLPDETVNYSSEHPLLSFAKVGGGVAGVIVGLYFVLGWSVDLLAEHISPEFERKILEVVSIDDADQNATEGLSALAESLAQCAALPYPAEVRLDLSEESNAYALPGGRIVINRGLFDEMGSENELAFILAHEMGHLKHRDHLRGMGRALVALSIGAVLGLSEAPDVLQSGMQFGESRFSQAQESAADAYALEVLQCRYGHVGGATDFFERHKNNDLSKWLLFTSHPELQQRIDQLHARAAGAGYLEGELLPALKR